MGVSTIPAEISSALARGSIILTAGQRAARTLHFAFDAAQRAQSIPSWAPPAIFALDTWLASLWTQLLLDGSEDRMLLNRTQQHALWRSIIAADRDVPALRSIDSLVELAARAWRLLCLHHGLARLPELTASPNTSTDTRAFARWARHFDRLLDRSLYLTPAQLPTALDAALARGVLSIPAAGLTLVDFDSLPPAPRRLFDSLARAGYPVAHLTTAAPTATATLYTAPDDHSELLAAAAWARHQLDENPAARLAIVVPALAARRAAIDRVFAETLAPELHSILATTPPPYEFSLGTPLADTSLAATALDLIRWTLEPLPLDRISTLLLSPFLADPAELQSAARFDAEDLRGRQLLRPELTLEAILDRLRASLLSSRLPNLHARLRALHRAASTARHEPRTYADCAAAFHTLLDAAGWSQRARADSLAFQTHRRWESALDELATLDFDPTLDLSAPSLAIALQALTRILRQTIFAPQSRHAPVQILGPLELGGVPLDALWFLSADDSSWPSPPAPNPLLPWHLQRDLRIPGADPAHDSNIAQSLTSRIANSATHAVFSYAAHSEAGDRRPSPLLRPLSLTPMPYVAPPLSTPLPLEAFADTESLPPLPGRVISGGATILQLQAACAFRAFAERRLFATEPDSPEPGLDPRERGSLVHNVMQLFWSRLETQAELRALPPLARDLLLAECIDAVLQTHITHAAIPWDHAYLDVQRQRLLNLLRPWLDVELDRPPFTVLQRETELPAASIGPLQLNLRVDRIDQTTAGDLIIDYKTGHAVPSEWLGERPDAPQLPLYAILSDRPPGGIAFALLRAGEDLGLKGFAEHRAVLDKPSRNLLTLPAQLEDWRRVLTGLASAFAQGDARVEPKAYPTTCKFCTQRTLCRLDPSTLQEFEDEDEDIREEFTFG